VLVEISALHYHSGMPQKPLLIFACAHLTDERLYAAQVAALEADYECTVFAFRNHDSLGGMAERLLAKTPARFTLIGLSLGGYLAFEIIRRELQRLERLILMDTTAVADQPARRAGRLADIAKVREGGIEALIPELPARWLHPEHVRRVELTNLMADMARSIGAWAIQSAERHAFAPRFACRSRTTACTHASSVWARGPGDAGARP
jgi:pimeloyl-ACP methyl ester carboxylesterase